MSMTIPPSTAGASAADLEHALPALAIYTRYLGPTNHRGARVAAQLASNVFETHRCVISYDHELGTLGSHAAAAALVVEALQDAYGIGYRCVARTASQDDRGFTFVVAATDRIQA